MLKSGPRRHWQALARSRRRSERGREAALGVGTGGDRTSLFAVGLVSPAATDLTPSTGCVSSTLGSVFSAEDMVACRVAVKPLRRPLLGYVTRRERGEKNRNPVGVAAQEPTRSSSSN